MFGFFREKKQLTGMKAFEIAEMFRRRYPNLVTKDSYVPPVNRCCRWIVLCGPVYNDKGFKGTLIVDSTEMYEWARAHATKTWCSRTSEQKAKEYFPHWISEINASSTEMTLLDEHQRAFLQPYKLDFIRKGWSQIWCPQCQKLHSKVTENDHNHERTNKTSTWVEEWLCPEEHLLYSENQEIRWIIR